MFRLNKKKLWVAGLMAAVALFAAAVHVLHRVQVRRSARALLAQAGRAEKEGSPAKVVDSLGRYLAYVPGDIDARARYGLALAAAAPAASPQARGRAIDVLEDVLRRAPGRHDVRRRLAGLAIDLRRYADARAHLEVLLNSSPENGEWEFLLGRCDEAEGAFDKAVLWYEKAGARRVLHPNTAARRKSRLARDYTAALAKARAST
jgi:cellulose synthase operon protein C